MPPMRPSGRAAASSGSLQPPPGFPKSLKHSVWCLPALQHVSLTLVTQPLAFSVFRTFV